jgi:hypothetical protein
MSLYDWYQVKSEYVEIKFSGPVKSSSLVNANFTVTNDTSGTPTTITDPFTTIDLTRDYSSLSRVLKLWFNFTIEADSDYSISIANILDVRGIVIATETIAFTTEPDYTASDEIEEPPTRTPVEVEDYSIKDISILVEAATPNTSTLVLKVSTVSPDTDVSYYLAEDYGNGVISVTFDQDLDTDFISTTYFKVHRKDLSAYITRWESVDIEVAASGARTVLIRLPSTEADQDIVYDTADRIYWEEGFKYRLRITSSVASTIGATLMENKEYLFLSQLTPLYYDAEKLVTYYPSVDLVEATQIIYSLSVELNDWFGDSIEITPLIEEYIKAATLCELSKIHVFDGGMSGFSNSDSFMLGDLQVMRKSGGGSSRNTPSRGSVGSWCELAALLREEVLFRKTGMRSVVKSENLTNPIPDRGLRRFD